MSSASLKNLVNLLDIKIVRSISFTQIYVLVNAPLKRLMIVMITIFLCPRITFFIKPLLNVG